MRTLLLTVVLAMSSSGCLIDIDYSDTRFRCQEEERCPEGYECVSGVCEPAGGQGGEDAGAADGGPADGGSPADGGAADSGASSGP